MSTGITTQGGTDRLNRILKLYHSTATQILRITGGDPTARIMVNNAFALPVQGILSAIGISQQLRPRMVVFREKTVKHRGDSMKRAVRLLLPVLCFSAFAQDVGQATSESSRASDLLVRMTHEWVLSRETPGGTEFICAIVRSNGTYHLERERRLMFSAAASVHPVEQSVHEGLLSDRDLRSIRSFIDDQEMKIFQQGPASDSIDIWGFEIFRSQGVQTIHLPNEKTIRSLEGLKSILANLEKHRPPALKGAKLTNCNLPRPISPGNRAVEK